MKKILSVLLTVAFILSFGVSVNALNLRIASELEKQFLPPDVLTMQNGTKVENKDQWVERQDEIREILQYYMYGPWCDGEGESLGYSIDGSTLKISVEYGGNTASFGVNISLPEGAPPTGGWPVIVVFGGIGAPQSYALSNGYAVISLEPNIIAADGTSRGGEFYKLYPYGSTWEAQSGVLMGWSWGASKILDALEKGAGNELGISTEKTIVTGVSRYGKAAAVAGAFDKRFAITMPVCSGFGGLTMGRYKSNNMTYNLLPDFENDPKNDSVGDLSAWKSVGGTEGIQGLQGSGWFNENYKDFSSYLEVPFDQHFLSALCASENRYLFMVTGINSDMWNSPPGLWYNYEQVLPAFELLGLSDNLSIQMHLNLHGIEIEDLIKLFAYADYHWYGKDFDTSSFPAPWNDILFDFTLDDLKTCIFASTENAEVYAAGVPDPNAFEGEGHPETSVPVDIMVGDVPVAVTVTRNENGDALVSSDADGKGFKFNYGPNLQYSNTFAKFDIILPPDLSISDFESVSFTCQTNANYWGKKMAFIAAPKSVGLPSEFEYDYNSGAITPPEVAALSTNNDLPPTTIAATPFTFVFDDTAASKVTGNEITCSIYIHMEHLDGDAEYIISDIVLNPRENVKVEYPTETEIAPVETTAATEVGTETTLAEAVQTDTAPESNSPIALVIIMIMAVLVVGGVITVLSVTKKRRK